MSESRRHTENYENYADCTFWSSSDEDNELKSETDEYHSPRFGELDDSENIDENEIDGLNYEHNSNYNMMSEPNITLNTDKFNNLELKKKSFQEQSTEWSMIGENNIDKGYLMENHIKDASEESCKETIDYVITENNSDITDRNDFGFHNNESKENTINSNNINKSDIKVEFDLNNADEGISYCELQSQIKSLLEISNKHQEEVHEELDSLISENERLKNEIESLNTKLKESDLNISKFKLNYIALSAQFPFLKSRTMLDEDKEELNSLRIKVKTLESKLKEAEYEIENYKVSEERASVLEVELERVTSEFSDLERFQTEQLRIADNEIIALTEAKNTLFRELHKVMKENESLKLTKTVIKRIESHYKNESDEIALRNIENELKESIIEFRENNEISDTESVKSAFEICQSIIPRLAFDIAEEIVISQNDPKEVNSCNKKKISFRKKNVSIQVGFPLVSAGSFENSEIDSISLRSELLALRDENGKLKKENQKLKQDIFLIKRVRNRTKGVNNLQVEITSQKSNENFGNTKKEEHMLNGIKWLTSVVNEIDELEQRCNKIKGVSTQRSDDKNSTCYNSTVASFEEIENFKSNDLHSKTSCQVNVELNLLREKLVNEGLLCKY